VTGAAVVDTNVFTARLRRDSGMATQYVKHLAGQLFTVAPQTVAEARYGALKSGSGPAADHGVAAMTANVIVLTVDAETVEQVAQLRNECRKTGHALHQAAHNADLWIAAAESAGVFRLSPTTPCSSPALAATCGRNSRADPASHAVSSLLRDWPNQRTQRGPPCGEAGMRACGE
jgi:predicted nucleic acid-binding protein